jgi:hypothetical protein
VCVSISICLESGMLYQAWVVSRTVLKKFRHFEFLIRNSLLIVLSFDLFP